ncbi:histone-lysine N-methyltransferase SETMAR [Trichonephila clavipes]|nr:histone-lysine N-methyltransferase SETMAR [Trichonephila clavipes]
MMNRISLCEAFVKRNVAAVAEWYRYRIVACLVTSSIPVPLKTRRVGQRCTLNLSRAETSSSWCGGELLPHGQTLNSDLYCQQLDRLELAIDCPETATIGQQKRSCVPSGQCQIAHFCSDSPEPLVAWLGSFNATTIWSGLDTKQLPPFSRIAKLPE